MSKKFSSTPHTLWDSVAEEYEGNSYDAQDGSYPANSYRSEILLDFFAKSPRGTVLDAGCGTGQMTRELLSRGWDVTSVDYSPEMIRVAKELTEKQGLNGKFYNYSLQELEKLAEKFDYIMLNGVLPYVATDEEPAVFEQLAKVSKSSTYLLSAHYNIYFNLLALDKWTAPAVADLLADSGLPAEAISETKAAISADINEADQSIDQERTMKMENPLSHAKKLSQFGFEQKDLAYYNFFYLPLSQQEKQDHQLREQMERKMRRSNQAILFARGFVSIAKRIG